MLNRELRRAFPNILFSSFDCLLTYSTHFWLQFERQLVERKQITQGILLGIALSNNDVAHDHSWFLLAQKLIYILQIISKLQAMFKLCYYFPFLKFSLQIFCVWDLWSSIIVQGKISVTCIRMNIIKGLTTFIISRRETRFPHKYMLGRKVKKKKNLIQWRNIFLGHWCASISFTIIIIMSTP